MIKTVFVKCGMNSFELKIDVATQKTRVTLSNDSGSEFYGEYDSPQIFADSLDGVGYGSLIRDALKKSGY